MIISSVGQAMVKETYLLTDRNGDGYAFSEGNLTFKIKILKNNTLPVSDTRADVN